MRLENSFEVPAQLTASPEQAQAAVDAQAKPVAGLPLLFRALGRAVTRPFRRRSR